MVNLTSTTMRKNTRSKDNTGTSSIRKRNAAQALVLEKENTLMNTSKRYNRGNVMRGNDPTRNNTGVGLLEGLAILATSKSILNNGIDK